MQTRTRRPLWARLLRGFLLSVLAVVVIAVLILTSPQVAPYVRRAIDPSAVTPAPADSDDDFTFILRSPDGMPARWNPCAPVHYVVNPSGAPKGAAATVDEAFRRVGRATGIEFVSDGETDERPSASRAAYQPRRYGRRWAPVLVAWVDPSAIGDRANELGSGAPFAVSAAGGRYVIVTGVVQLSRRAALASGFSSARTWGAVELHEIAHVVGLGHAREPTQLMYPTVSIRPSSGNWGRGDRAGLEAAGRDAGCLDVPRPQPVPALEP